MNWQLIAAGLIGLCTSVQVVAGNPEFDDIAQNLKRFQKAYDAVAGVCSLMERSVVQTSQNKRFTLQIKKNGWTGQCINGRAEGPGVLSISVTSDSTDFDFRAGNRILEGTMLRGRQIGPWYQREVRTVQPFSNDNTLKPSASEGSWFWTDTIVPGTYIATGDGGFVHGDLRGTPLAWQRDPTAQVIPATYVTQYFAAADALRSGRSVPTLPLQYSAILQGLLPQAQAAQSLDGPMTGTHEKKIALIFSERSYRSFQDMSDFGTQLRAYAEGKRDLELSAAIQDLGAAVTPLAVVRNAAASVRGRFKSVELVSDLRGFMRSDADAAMVIDFTFVHDAAWLTNAYDRIGRDTTQFSSGPSKVDPISAVSVKMAALILDRQLQVRQGIAPSNGGLVVDAIPSESTVVSAIRNNVRAVNKVLAPTANDHGYLYLSLGSALDND